MNISSITQATEYIYYLWINFIASDFVGWRLKTLFECTKEFLCWRTFRLPRKTLLSTIRKSVIKVNLFISLCIMYKNAESYKCNTYSSEWSSFLGELLAPGLSGVLTTSPSAEYLIDMDTLSGLPFMVPIPLIIDPCELPCAPFLGVPSSWSALWPAPEPLFEILFSTSSDWSNTCLKWFWNELKCLNPISYEIPRLKI